MSASRPFGWSHRQMGPTSMLQQLPQEVIERICQLLPASSKTSACLSLVRTSKLWYAPAIRELFASVTLEIEEHAQGALSTLASDQRIDGALALTVRKICLVVGDEGSRTPPPPPRLPLANLAVAPPPPLLAHNMGAGTSHAILGQGNGGPGGLATLAQLIPGQLQNMHHTAVGLNAENMLQIATLGLANPLQLTPLLAGATPPPLEDGWALEVPSLQPQQLALDEFVNGQRSSEAVTTNPAPLTLTSALDFLSQTKCIHALTIRLPTAQLIDERTLSVLSRLSLLRKLDIAGKLGFQQLWQLLKSLPWLEDLTVSGLSTGEDPDAPSYHDSFNFTPLRLHSLALHCSELDTELLSGILQSCDRSIVNIKLSRFITSSRLRFKALLRMIGPSLRSLAIHRLVFRGPAPLATEPHLLHILDDLPTFCPMLEELQVAAERIVSPAYFFTTVLPSLFLTQLELDYYYPIVTEEQIMRLIHSLPAGRTETLSFGSKMNHLLTPKVQRACQEIGIVALGANAMEG